MKLRPLILLRTFIALATFAIGTIAIGGVATSASAQDEIPAQLHEEPQKDMGIHDVVPPAVPGEPTDVPGAEHALEQDGVVVSDLDHGTEHGSGGLPQLDFSTYPSQIFWLFVVFLILYVLFSKKTLPEISSVIEKRRSHVQNDLGTAQELREEAEGVQKSHEDALEEVRTRATELYEKVQDEIKRKTSKKLESFTNTSQRKIRDTEASIDEAKAHALVEMQAVAAEAASLAAEKIIGVSTDIDQAKTLVRNMGRKAA